MRALTFVAHQQCQIHTIDVPEPANGESLIKIEAAGICGSDMHAWHGHDDRRQPPLILGHEVCGVVVEGKMKGQRVTANPRMTCGHCVSCQQGKENVCSNLRMIGMTQPGGMAEYLCIDDHCLIDVHDTPAKIAVLAEPLAVCLHGIHLLQRFNPQPLKQQTVLILGGGAIGILTAILLRHFGVNDISLSEPNPLRLETCQELLTCINPQQQPPPKQHYDAVFDAVGIKTTRQQAIDSVKSSSTVIHLGLQDGSGDMDARQMTLREIFFCGAFTYTMQEMIEAAQLLADDQFVQLLQQIDWLEYLPLDQGQQGFERIHNGTTAAGKVILLT